jgi:hypothetical protein
MQEINRTRRLFQFWQAGRRIMMNTVTGQIQTREAFGDNTENLREVMPGQNFYWIVL